VERSLRSPLVQDREDALEEAGSGFDGEQLSLPSYDPFPPTILRFLERYGISTSELVKYAIGYSGRYEQLIFPYYDKEGKLCCIQARNFNESRAKKAKYYNRGSPQETLPIRSSKGICSQENEDFKLDGPQPRLGNSIVITEDALSSIKVARQCDAMPCLGTYLPLHKIIALRALYDKVVVWLDSDKWREARAIADSCKLVGLSATTLLTELDPKCYSDEQINEYLK